jgi:hypothetical protein
VYEGEWKDGKQHGQGKNTFPSGNVYEGEWKGDKKHGQGKYTGSNGFVYEGEWKGDKKHGQGKVTDSDGDVYEGEWKDDNMHGQGKATYSDGDVYEGEWKDGKRHFTYLDSVVWWLGWVLCVVFGGLGWYYVVGWGIYATGWFDFFPHPHHRFRQIASGVLQALQYSARWCLRQVERVALPQAQVAWPQDIEIPDELVDDEDGVVPGNLCCHITASIMRNPVMVHTSGRTYENESIRQWHATRNNRDPITGIEFRVPQDLAPNFRMRDEIETFIATFIAGRQEV